MVPTLGTYGTGILRRASSACGRCLTALLRDSAVEREAEKRGRGIFQIFANGIHLSSRRREQCDKSLRSPPCLRDELICEVVDPVLDSCTKVTVVGAGMLGIACANAILFQKISSHVALVDAFPKKLRGEGLDYHHGLSFLGDPRVEFDTDFCVSTNSKVVVVTTGARQCDDESRIELVQRNADIIKTIILPLVEYSPKAVFLIVTNPVDILSWVAWKISGLPVNRIIGSGTNVDTAKFRSLIGRRLGIGSSSINAMIIGEHGETQVPLWSGVNVAGVLFREILSNIGMGTDEEKWDEVSKEVVNSEATVRCLKGYCNTALGLSVADIVKDILRNTQMIKPVSTLAQGHYDICQEVFLSLPCTLGENGVTNVTRVRITEMEKKRLAASADHIFQMQKKIKL